MPVLCFFIGLFYSFTGLFCSFTGTIRRTPMPELTPVLLAGGKHAFTRWASLVRQVHVSNTLATH